MPRPEIDIEADFSNAKVNTDAQVEISTLTGPYKLVAKPIDPRHSDPQRRYFHGVLCKAMVQYDAAQGNTLTTAEAKRILVRECLGARPFKDRKGRIVDWVVPSTANLSKPEYSLLIEKGHAYLFQMGIPLPTYRQYAETWKPARRNKQAEGAAI